MKAVRGLTLALCCAVTPAWAIDTEQLKPKAPERQGTGEIIEPAPAEAPPADERVLLDALRGLVLTGDIDGVRAEGRDQQGIVVEALPDNVADALRQRMQSYLGEPLSLAGLNRINRDIVAVLREQDYPVSDALTPGGQDITNGVVQIVVLLARLDAVSASGGEYFRDVDVAEQFNVVPGDVLRGGVLRDELAWANRNPFRSVNLLLEPGESPGTASIDLQVQDQRPWRFYTGAEDSGTRATGDNRWFVGANWGNAFGLDHQMSYQYAQSFESDLMEAHSLSYLAPLASRHTFSASLGRALSRPDAGVGLTSEGRNTDVSLRYSVPMPVWSGWRSNADVGYDYRRSNNDLEFGGLQVFNSSIEVSQFMLGYGGSVADRWGVNSAQVQWFYSPGGMTARNEDDDFSIARADAGANYHYVSLALSREQPLLRDWLWRISGRGQLASDNLVGSEQFVLGGYATVRGYDNFVVSGDQGWLLSSEWMTPAVMPLSATGMGVAEESLRGLVFVDSGMTRAKQPLPGEPVYRLTSVGIGLRYQIGTHLSLRADYGWQTQRLAGSSEPRDHRGHVSMTLAF